MMRCKHVRSLTLRKPGAIGKEEEEEAQKSCEGIGSTGAEGDLKTVPMHRAKYEAGAYGR